MSDVTSRIDAATVSGTGPSFVAALCGFVSSMMAASALVMLLMTL